MSQQVPLAEIYNDIASAIGGKKSRAFHWSTPWLHKVHTVEMARGARIVVEELPGQELVVTELEDVVNKIVTWLRAQPDPETLLTYRQAKEAAQTWVAASVPLRPQEIKMVSWVDETGYTWRRLPWAIAEGPTPTWDKILNRMTNATAFCQWLGSLFFDEARQHQYVWVHGMGNDGKGSINNFLKAVFGRAYRSKQPPHPGDKFWTHGLIGSRLVVFPDCNAQGFTSGGLFKSLSGGDPIDVESKGKMSFTVDLNCKFLFFSNEKPNISCEDADMRRIIYCEFFEKTKKEDADPFFAKKLWSEGGAFLSRCVNEYTAACPQHAPITSGKEEIEAWVSVGEEKFQTFFDFRYKQPREEYRTTKLLPTLTDEQLDLVTVKPEVLLASLQAAFPERREQAQFRDWLYKKYGVQKRGVRRKNGATPYRYVGLMENLTGVAGDKRRRDVENLYRNFRVLSTPSTVDESSI
jgi:hypothetical protein